MRLTFVSTTSARAGGLLRVIPRFKLSSCSGNIKAMRHGEITDLKSPGLATLAGDLTLLVDRLQSDWDECRTVRPETAEELHDLRRRAERLLCNFG